MKREIDGFVMNRMQGALLEEACRLVADGYATAEDIDVGIREGLGRARWRVSACAMVSSRRFPQCCLRRPPSGRPRIHRSAADAKFYSK